MSLPLDFVPKKPFEGFKWKGFKWGLTPLQKNVDNSAGVLIS